MNKKMKYALYALGVFTLLYAVYYFFFKSKWTAHPNMDIRGFDISNEANVTLDQAKANAQTLGASSFVYYAADKRAWYKSGGTLEAAWNPGAVAYTK